MNKRSAGGLGLKREPKERCAFPSPRQARCSGLRREFYPAFLRDLVDYDYEDKLPENARIWLAAFTEEHYRGWRLAGETQVNPLEALRAAGAARMRAKRNEDVMSFGKHRGPSMDHEPRLRRAS